MNDDIIAGRWKQLIGQATTRFGQLTSADWTALGGRVESFVGRLQERFGLAREQALAAVDEISAETSAIVAQLDADRRAEERMDADYGSGPRPGLDNLAAIPVADSPLPLDRWLRERLAGLGSRVLDEVRQRPGWALLAAASAGYLVARSARVQRKAA
ncbi:MAG: hypothetical protein JNL89_11320 [Rhodanobacteraceae bacterium]|nr:hypothetical protein [Rhodanobacteraceae bacterium]